MALDPCWAGRDVLAWQRGYAPGAGDRQGKGKGSGRGSGRGSGTKWLTTVSRHLAQVDHPLNALFRTPLRLRLRGAGFVSDVLHELRSRCS
jgi:hypothetical protein